MQIREIFRNLLILSPSRSQILSAASRQSGMSTTRIQQWAEQDHDHLPPDISAAITTSVGLTDGRPSPNRVQFWRVTDTQFGKLAGTLEGNRGYLALHSLLGGYAHQKSPIPNFSVVLLQDRSPASLLRGKYHFLLRGDGFRAVLSVRTRLIGPSPAVGFMMRHAGLKPHHEVVAHRLDTDAARAISSQLMTAAEFDSLYAGMPLASLRAHDAWLDVGQRLAEKGITPGEALKLVLAAQPASACQTPESSADVPLDSSVGQTAGATQPSPVDELCNTHSPRAPVLQLAVQRTLALKREADMAASISPAPETVPARTRIRNT